MQGSLTRVMRDIKSERKINSIFTDIYYLLLVVIFFTAALMSGTQNEYFKYMDKLDYTVSAFALLAHVPLLILAAIYCAQIFRDVHSSTQADVILSLPMSAAQRYFSKAAEYIFLIVIPYLITAVLSVAGMVIANKLIWQTIIPSEYIFTSGATYFLAGLSAVMFIGAVGFICSSFSTSLPEAVITTAASGIALTLLPPYFIKNLLLGSSYISTIHTNFFTLNLWSMTPLYSVLEMNNVSPIEPDHDLVPFILAMILNIFISLIVMVLGCFVYKRRDKSTLTFNKLSLPFLFCIISLIVIDTWLFNINTQYFSYIGYGFLLAGFAAFVLVQRRRGFKTARLLKWGIGFVAMPVVFTGLSAVIYFTDGLHISNTPDYLDGNMEISVYIHTPSELYPNETDLDQIEHPFRDSCEITILNGSRDDLIKVAELLEKYREDPKDIWTFLDFMGIYKNSSSGHTSYEKDQYSASFLSDEYHMMPKGMEEYSVGILKQPLDEITGFDGYTCFYGFTKGIDEQEMIDAVSAINSNIVVYHRSPFDEIMYRIENGVKEEYMKDGVYLDGYDPDEINILDDREFPDEEWEEE